MATSLEACHVACSANRAGPGVISWGRGTLLAFGSCRSVILYDPQKRKVVGTLNGHTERINCVKWIRRKDGSYETELISGGSDKTLILWEIQNEKMPFMSMCLLMASLCGVTPKDELLSGCLKQQQT
uniref:Elongator complex protein 2 n=1 Tax=Naja naja TaxID=35670 RepID=A0A8C6VEX4_NAJNA